MRQIMLAGAFALLAGCAGMPSFGPGPSLDALQRACGEPHDYGGDAPAVQAALQDAWVAQRHRGLMQAQYCGFANALAAHHAALGARPGAAAREQWVNYLNEQRAQAISWRSRVDPTLRGG
ncbi:hypothetical protein [Burkholderia glumae]|uniref:Lipoprotein n=1 Tax=Burkholderia glumae TaxID=337 RepID=A0AAQ0BTZ5_BURGL|nr:hypothetical protein [Burkholderia glumae]ACR30103.1 Hypothetical protein bglu_1g30400 [Burkholderia glumae BGR1]AJY67366.1 hypothetical protein KS03_494 [Burkholderia glumae LMG 2196 = ATCC 33617]KHJ60174.1 hypothetical protein NCPPB3923_25480 [Burkholderia glumae]MCM2482254.1 hypothetical protein [Burkholderia glumae]MCM2507603.1 hypothetical protein [Burkholderia glumae]